MVMIILYAKQQKRHRCIEQSFGLRGRGQGWDDLGEWHWNMYNIIYETNYQSWFDAGCRMLGAGALGWPRGIVQGGRWEEGSEWGTHVHLWRIHVNVWQNQYNIVKFKKIIIIIINKNPFIFISWFPGGSDIKASAHDVGDLGSIPGSGRSPGEGNGNPLQYYCLESPMDRGAW